MNLTEKEFTIVCSGIAHIIKCFEERGQPHYKYQKEEVLSLEKKLNAFNVNAYEITIAKHPTEEKYPEQTARFREILDEMYKVHLEKNADYSPYNILVTGMKGCITRLWDKSARFFNLMGIDIINFTWDEEKINSVKDEPIEQTLLDWANYCIITRIFREGKWGK